MRWRGLDVRDRRALMQAGWRLLIVRGLLAVSGVAATQRMLARISPAPADRSTLISVEPWHRRALALRRVARRVPGARCLARSMVLWWWMRTDGFDPRLCMGVRPGIESLEGHAWIECDGHIIDETAESAATYHGLDWRSPE